MSRRQSTALSYGVFTGPPQSLIDTSTRKASSTQASGATPAEKHREHRYPFLGGYRPSDREPTEEAMRAAIENTQSGSTLSH